MLVGHPAGTFIQALAAHVAVLRMRMAQFAVTVLGMSRYMVTVGISVMLMIFMTMIVTAPTTVSVVMTVSVLLMTMSMVMSAPAAVSMFMTVSMLLMVMSMVMFFVAVAMLFRRPSVSSPLPFLHHNLRLQIRSDLLNLRKQSIRIRRSEERRVGKECVFV